MSWNLTECCAGGGALTLSYLEAKGQIVPYQGSKWRLRQDLADIITGRGYAPGKLKSAHLVDAGPWGDTWKTLADYRLWVRDKLSTYVGKDPRFVYDSLHGHHASRNPVTRTAQHLFLSRLAFSGKAVSDAGDIWKSAGFNKSSAYGVDGTEKFGQVRPMVPALIERLGEPWGGILIRGERSCSLKANYKTNKNSVVYIDPPYVGTTGYPGVSLSRESVITLATRMNELAGLVIVSGAEPVPALIESGWTSKCLRGPATHTARFRSKAPEYVTISPE